MEQERSSSSAVLQKSAHEEVQSGGAILDRSMLVTRRKQQTALTAGVHQQSWITLRKIVHLCHPRPRRSKTTSAPNLVYPCSSLHVVAGWCNCTALLYWQRFVDGFSCRCRVRQV